MAHESLLQKLRKVVYAAALVAFCTGSALAQSAEEATQDIQNRATDCVNTFRSALEAICRNPETLVDGTAVAVAENCSTELVAIDQQIESQLQFLKTKEERLAGSVQLSESDRKELLTALEEQKTPLQTLKKTNATWQNVLSTFTNTVTKEWLDLYTTYADIEGEKKATTKLARRVTSYLEGLPSDRLTARPPLPSSASNKQVGKNSPLPRMKSFGTATPWWRATR